MTRQQETSQRMQAATDRLQKLAASNAPHGARLNAEREYRDAYQELVRDGHRRQIRGKYRTG